MILAFELSMPKSGAWNGRWSGEGRVFAKTRTTRSQEVVDKTVGSYTYVWSDGWVARVTARVVTASEAAKLRRQSLGFMGYDWMIDDIMKYGEIRQR
jgi:hypothetical protein